MGSALPKGMAAVYMRIPIGDKETWKEIAKVVGVPMTTVFLTWLESMKPKKGKRK